VVGLEDVVEEPPPAAPAAAEAPASRSATDVGLRAITALGLLVLFAAALVHPLGLTVIAVILFALAAGEFYAVLVRTGQHPLSLFGLLGAAGGLIGAAVWGLGAIPVAIIATLVAVALYYALTSSHPDPLTDGGLTVMVVAWAMLGAFVFPIVDSPEFRWWVAAIVIVVVAMDVGQYFVGRSIGSRPLAPLVSPKKTVEGLLGGVAVAVVAAVVLSFLGPLTLPSMLALAGATVVLAPLGDLSVSLVKRIIGVKDMGTILPGHGGILDRVDGLLFVVPAAWVIFDAMGLLT
jgi:phosphatidate cytidylyltransferase